MYDNSNHSPISTQPNFGVLQEQGVSKALVTYNHITYALAMLSYFTAGLTWIIPIVMNYLKRDEARYTWLYSHFDWQIKTFWYSIFFGGIAMLLMVFGFGVSFFGLLTDNKAVFGNSFWVGFVGAVMFVVVLIWHFYRMVRGWIALSNAKAVP